MNNFLCNELNNNLNNNLNNKNKCILFIEHCDINYDLDSLSNIPLGGTQSVLVNLFNYLIKKNYNVILLSKKNRLTIGKNFFNLPHNNDEKCINYYLRFLKYDAIIIVNVSHFINSIINTLIDINSNINSNTNSNTNSNINSNNILNNIYYYIHHSYDQNDVVYIPQIKKYNENLLNQKLNLKYLFVSNNQKNNFLNYKKFNDYFKDYDPNLLYVLKNSYSPFFDNIKLTIEVINNKLKNPSLIYASTPNRGLDLLLKFFINKLIKIYPNIILHVCSDFKVYNSLYLDSQLEYQNLYNICKKHPNIIYHGTINSLELSKIMEKSLILCYPNTYLETSCITVLQSVVSGNYILSSNTGALPETLENINTAYLYHINNEYEEKFIEKINSILCHDVNTIYNELLYSANIIKKNYNIDKCGLDFEKILHNI